ncbi:MAG: hypothetical protein FJX78_04500 [Armatimonadetes bacterium]|nr:hypothetical protein [Armatimonadota bacterium]
MKRFRRLFLDLDATNRTSEKQAALERYFRDAPPADAAWALFFLRGGWVGRAITWPQLRDWGASEADVPGWLLEEC